MTDTPFIKPEVLPANYTPQNLTISTPRQYNNVKYWDRQTINQKIDATINPQHQMLLRLLWISGIRITEAITITKNKIDFQNYTIEIKWLKSRKNHTRIIPMHPRLRDALQIYTANMKPEERVFPISRQWAWTIIKKTMGGNPHMLRHSFAINYLQCQGNPGMLRKIMGHKDYKTTEQYLDISPVDQGKELLKIQF